MFKRIFKARNFPYLLIIPFIIFFTAFRAIPILYTTILSLFTGSIDIDNFVWISNYQRLFVDPLFYKSIFNTIIIFLFQLLITLPFVVFLSLAIVKSKRRGLILGLLLVPTFVGMFAYAIFFRYMFTENGLINNAIALIFNHRFDWFGSPIMARLMLAIALSWTNIGFFTLIYTNAIKSIPNYYFDVLRLDSVSRFKRYVHIQFPLSLPTIKSIIFMIAIEAFALVDLPLNLTAGAPQQATLTLPYYIYLHGLRYNDFPYAAAISIVITIVFVLLFNLKKQKDDDIYEVV